MIDVLDELYGKFDTIVAGLQGSVFAALSADAAKFLSLLIAVSFAYYFAMSAARKQIDPLGIFYFMVRASLLYALVAGGTLWSTYAYPFFSEFAEKVGVTMYNAVSSRSVAGTESFPALLEIYYDLVIKRIQELWDQVQGGRILNMAEITGGLTVLFAWIFTLALIALAFALLMISKVAIAILLAVAPIYLLWAFVGSTSDIARGWLSGITKVMTLQVMVFAILGLVIAVTEEVDGNVFANFSTEIAAAGEKNKEILVKLGEIMFVTLFGNILLFSAPVLSNMAGGGAVSFGASVANFARNQMIAAPGNADRAIGATDNVLSAQAGAAYGAVKGRQDNNPITAASTERSQGSLAAARLNAMKD